MKLTIHIGVVDEHHHNIQGGNEMVEVSDDFMKAVNGLVETAYETIGQLASIQDCPEDIAMLANAVDRVKAHSPVTE
jgi:flagellin-like hook-associated protein FlgL